MNKDKKSLVILIERIQKLILLIRGQKTILDRDLAVLYCVETRVLNQAVTRNIKRFPGDFMFQLTRQELGVLMSQDVISKTKGSGGVHKLPRAFTEQGVAMLSTVLKSERAIEVNIEIMRAFVRLRQILTTHATLAHKLGLLEKKYDRRFRVVFEAIRQLMKPPESKRQTIVFQVAEKKIKHKSNN